MASVSFATSYEQVRRDQSGCPDAARPPSAPLRPPRNRCIFSCMDLDLVRIINRGRCFILVGAGPSCELGYPDWNSLCDNLAAAARQARPKFDETSYKAYYQSGKLPQAIGVVERHLGGREELCDVLRSVLRPKYTRGQVYDFITKWPFACYLTTNFDEELHKRLEPHGYILLGNEPKELAALRDMASKYIVHLHGSFKEPELMVLTGEDYFKFAYSTPGKLFRDRLAAIFATFDILILGYSLSDPDLIIPLTAAKEIGNPQTPIHMYVADATPAQQSEYLHNYNIRIHSYDNRSGDHSGLGRKLASLGKWIPSRDRRTIADHQESLPDADAAAALLIHRRLAFEKGIPQAELGNHFAPLVLQALIRLGGRATLSDLTQGEPIATIFSAKPMASLLPDVIHNLESTRQLSQDGEDIIITEEGRDAVESIYTIRDEEKRQSLKAFCDILKHLAPDATQGDIDRCTELMSRAVVSVFSARGLAIAKSILARQGISPAELTDILQYIVNSASELEVGDLRAAFIDAAHAFLVEPTPTQARFLESVSQGYFLYHLLGTDPHCHDAIHGMVENTTWVLDSSVLLPLLAVGCGMHDLLVGLQEELARRKVRLLTTKKLLQECVDHLNWARHNVPLQNCGMDPHFQAVALGADGSRQNLFIDGFIRYSSERAINSFNEYLDMVTPIAPTPTRIEKALEKRGIVVLSDDDIVPPIERVCLDFKELLKNIRTDREDHGTFRSELQVEAEAEVLWFIRTSIANESEQSVHQAERRYFMSTSGVLARVHGEGRIVWEPESLYRYLSSLPDQATKPDLLHRCLLIELYQSGINIIDRSKYSRFFSGAINSAVLSYAEQKSEYQRAVERQFAVRLDDDFQRLPDLEKPLFVAQMGVKVFETMKARADQLRNELDATQAQLRDLKRQRDKGWKQKQSRREKHAAATERNKLDPKRQRKLTRKNKGKGK